MKKVLTCKRLLAVVLCLVMVLGVVPVIPISLGTGAFTADDVGNYVTLPITIRDYAADGMLFEYNDLPFDGETWVGKGTDLFATRRLYAGTNGLTSWAEELSQRTGYPFTIKRKVAYDAANEGSRYQIGTPDGNDGASMRYVALKYAQTSKAAYQAPHLMYYNGSELVADVALNWACNGTVHTVVVDMGYHDTTITSVRYQSYLTKEQSATIYWAQAFATQEEAEAFNQSGGVGAQPYLHGNNLGYGLLGTDGHSKVNNLSGTNTILGTTLVNNGGWNSATAPDPVQLTLNSGAAQTLYGGKIRTDLVESTLGANGKPVYTQATVDYLADYMRQTLTAPQYDASGAMNLWYVMGAKVFGDSDLATKLRAQVGTNMGTYDEARAKFDAGNLTDYTQVSSYYDAAYFLLHNLFADNAGYGQIVDAYDTLYLKQKTDAATGKTYYTFNSAYDGVVYDTVNGDIYNSQIETITQRKYLYSTEWQDWYVRGNVMPYNCFNPLANLGYGKELSNATYNDLVDGLGLADQNEPSDGSSYYDKVNFHYVMEGHAQFIYHADDFLYFTFTGDDDVYLYINGTRVLDVGGAHAISKVTVDLNAVAELCGLKDGEIYTFDFFYMERHGTSANLGLETNIKIVDPSMVTEKRAWQGGNQVGYNGYVVPNNDIIYDFAVTNNGDAHIQNLTFQDNALGVYLTPTALTLGDNAITDIAVRHFAADGTVKAFTNPADMTEEILKSYLTNGLAVGEKLLVYGFKHQLTDADPDTFDNYVYTTAVALGDNVDDNKRTLNGMAHHRVQKAIYDLPALEFYDGGRLNGETYGALDENKSFGVTITRDELLAPMKNHAELKNLDYTDATITLTTAGGNASHVNYNATVQADGSIFFQTDKTGLELFYYTVTVGGIAYQPIAVQVYTYGVSDNVFVLDYNLPVELFAGEHGMTQNDILRLDANRNTNYTWKVQTALNGTYGDFTTAEDSLCYTMNRFMNGVDSIEIQFTVMKNGATTLDKTTGVAMTQKVTVVPANVVYYEDDFEDITYVNTGSDASGNIWAVYEGSNKGDQQSADQTLNYGYDPNYADGQTDIYNHLTLSYLDGADAAWLTAVGDNIFHTIYGAESEDVIHALYGDASNDTIHAMSIQEQAVAPLMSFEFTGTGFEIVGRTTTGAYAVLTIVVEDVSEVDENGKGTIVKTIPVITECVGGDLTQVPFIARKDMDYSQYRVTMYGSNQKSVARMVYVDGVRIYKPLTEEQEKLYYKADEKQATIREIKTEIVGGKIVYGQMSVDNSTSSSMWQYGSTMIENFTGMDFVLNPTFNYKDYAQYGPNNEIYLGNPVLADGVAPESILSYIAFYVELDESFTEGERSIQIGAHLKSTTDNYVDDETADLSQIELVYGSSGSSFGANGNVHTVASGTEQYFTLDMEPVFINANGTPKALVIVGCRDKNGSILALTNIKLNGYKIASGTAAEVDVIQDMDDANASTLMAETKALYLAMLNEGK